MKIYRTVLFLFLITGSASAFAMPPDSTGIKWIKGKKYILYKVEQSEGWYGIGRKYNLSVDELQWYNEDVKDKPLKSGQILFIPVVMAGVAETEPQEGKPIYHKIKKKETLYSIAKEEEVTIAEIKKWNNLKSDTVQTGEKIIVGYKLKKNKDKRPVAGSAEPMGAPGIVKEPEPKKDTIAVIAKKDLPKEVKDSVKVDTVKKDNTGFTKAPVLKGREFEERGVATFIEDEDINPHKYYALHKTAPRGTIVKVTNIMNNKMIYVKVIGTLPNTGDNNDIIIKISKASAMKLNVLDSRFQVILNYFGE